MKDEAGGKIIEEFVGLRAKLYSYKMFEGKEEKKCKGIKKSVVIKKIFPMRTTKILPFQRKTSNEKNECYQKPRIMKYFPRL